MSDKHPIIAVTGSSGAGTTSVKRAFENIFLRMQLNSVVVEGDSFHRFDRTAMKQQMLQHADADIPFSHFSPRANYFDKIVELFQQYGKDGSGKRRFYLHTVEEAKPFDLEPGQFSPWENLPKTTDLLFL